MLYLAFAGVFLLLWGCFYAVLPALRRGDALAARLFDRLTFGSRLKPYVPLVLILVIGGLAIAWAGDQFVDLAELVRAKNPKLENVDVRAHSWAISKRTASDTSFFELMSNIGSPVGMTSIAAIVAIVLAIRKRFRWMFYLIITAGGGALMNLELKRYFARARPDIAEMLLKASGYSFPSGHAMGSTVVLCALSYLAARTATRWRWKAACLALAWTLILSISLSRVYLGVHWISDVAAGICIGGLWVALTTVSYETARRIRLLRTGRVSDS
jgi:membrane-associated phospholipid phosphatase